MTETRNLGLLLFLALLAASFPGASRAQADEDLAREIGALVEPFLESFPGISVAVAQAGQEARSFSYGFADPTDQSPLTSETRSRVYSVSKPWVAAAGLRLAEARKLDPQAAIGSFLPDLPAALAGITILQLATHTSGIRHYADSDADLTCSSLQGAVDGFKSDSLLFEPGTSQAYSSWGYVLLSQVLEAASGESFTELMRQQVFAPLEMDMVELSGTESSGFVRDQGPWESSSSDISCKYGAGGFTATASDLVQFYLGVMSDSFLSPPSKGLILRTNHEGVARIQGVNEGGRAQVYVDTAHGTVIAITGNAAGDDVTFDSLHETAAKVALLVR